MKVTNLKKLNFKKLDGLLPAVIQDSHTAQVLMLGFMNKESLQKTIRTQKVWFYSRSRGRLWMKGELSKHTLKVVSIASDCDRDTLLIQVEPAGPTCHTGNTSCFNAPEQGNELRKLFAIVESRKNELPRNSYTTSLFKAGSDKISLKVAEEFLEVLQAIKKETKGRLVEETVDLFYHLFVLLIGKNISWQELEAEIRTRQNNKASGFFHFR